MERCGAVGNVSPVFIYAAHRGSIGRTLSDAADVGFRRWLSYLTVFGAAVVLVIDLASLIYNVLGGELTTRFFLKVLTVDAVAGEVLSFFLLDLRSDETE